MAATLGSLVIQLQADLARLQSDMGKAVGIVERGSAAMSAAAGVAKQALIGVGTGLVAGLAGGGLASAIKEAVDYGDRLNDLSKATGASVEQLSFLDYAAKQSGTSLEGITSGIGRLQKNLIEVSNGGGPAAARALRALGLDARELASADLATQLGTIGDKLKDIKNPAERAATAQALFGKGARELVPLLLEGTEGLDDMIARFRELGGEVSTGVAQKFDKLNDTFVDFDVATGALKRNVAEAVTGPLTSFVNFWVDAPDVISGALSNLTARFGVWANELKIVFAEADIATQTALRDLIPGDVGDQRFDAKIAEGIERLEAAKAGLVKAREILDIETERPPGSRGGAPRLGGNTVAPPSDSPTDGQLKEFERLKEAQDSYLDGFRKQLALQDQTTEAARVQADIAFGSAAKFDEVTQRTALALAEQLDLKKQQADADKEALAAQEARLDALEEEAELEAKAQQAIVQRRQAIIDQLQTPLEKYVETVKELSSPELGLGQETIQRGIRAARTELETAQDKANGLKDVAQELGLTFSSAFEDAIIAGKSFQSILVGIAQDIARLFIRKSITEPLVGALSGAFSNGLSGLFGGGGGGGFSNPGALDFGGARATGGSVSPGKFYMVGERGPEYFAPGVSGAIVPAGAGGLEVNVYNQNGSDVQARRSPDGRAIEVVVANALESKVARGGSRLGLKPPLVTR